MSPDVCFWACFFYIYIYSIKNSYLYRSSRIVSRSSVMISAAWRPSAFMTKVLFRKSAVIESYLVLTTPEPCNNNIHWFSGGKSDGS